MEKSTLRRADLVTSVILMLVAIGGFYMSLLLFLKTLDRGKDWFKSAGLFPMIILFFLFVCSLMLFTKARRDGARFDFFTKDKVIHLFKSKEFQVAIIVIGMLAGYIFVLIPLLSYWISTSIYVFGFMVYFKKERSLKDLLKILIITVCVTAALTYGFGTLAQIPLP